MTKRTIWLVILLFITNICSFSANKINWSNTNYKNVDEWIKFGKKHLRRAYRNGGVGPYAFDCSGFTMYMYKELGYALPHSSSAQSDHGDKIKATNVMPGDLVFYSGSKGSSIGHVGIVIEVTDNDFSFIHASLKQGICIDKSTHQYYKSRYKTARRIFDLTADNSKKKKEEETIPTPTPKPQDEELDSRGRKNDLDNQSNKHSVDNDKKIAPKKKESRRERRKRLKAEKKRLEKEKAEKKKQEEEARKKAKKENKKSKKEVEKEPVKKTSKREVAPVVVKNTHIVEKGETMYRISKMAGLTVDELKEINGLKSNDLKIGQELIIEK